jgi:hypothetical protein
MSLERKKALLPGFGRPLNYNPVNTDPDYVGELFKNALSAQNIMDEAPGVAYVPRLTTCYGIFFTILKPVNPYSPRTGNVAFHEHCD